MNTLNISVIVESFIRAAVWADSDEGTAPRVPRDTRRHAERFVRDFLAAHPELCKAAMSAPGYESHPDAGSPEAAFGHDLYLTARGHGVGFWDRPELGETGGALTAALAADHRRWYVETYQHRGWLYLLTAQPAADDAAVRARLAEQ